MNKIEQIKKWLINNEGKKIWIKQFAYNIGVDITMNEGYVFYEEMEGSFLLEDSTDQDTNVQLLLFDTDEDVIKIGYNEDTFGGEALDFEADFEISLEHGVLLFILL